MGMRLNLVPELGLRGNKRLQALLQPYLRDFAHMPCRDIARKWIADQEFWAPRPWLQDLLSRPDRLELITRALALLICEEEGIRARRYRGRHGQERARPGHAGRLRRAAVPILIARAYR